MTDVEALLRKVHERLGGVGIDIHTFGGDHAVEVLWARDYDGELSDKRFTSAPTLAAALQAILDYEDEADARETDDWRVS